jgi:uncharacterized tellurite resistance protein B-like protein
MGTSELQTGLCQKRNISHFANIVRIAKSDNEISPGEIAFLSEVSKKYQISNEDFKQILRHPEDIPTLAHLDRLDRIGRLYELLIMIRSDDHIRKEEVSMLRKIATGLSFSFMEVDLIVDESLKIDIESTNLEAFTSEILKLLDQNS